MDKVSFGSIQNTGARVMAQTKNQEWFKMAIQLTDEGGKDLSKYKDIFDKFPDPKNNGFLSIDCFTRSFAPAPDLKINGKSLDIENDPKLIVFDKLTKLFKTVENTQSPFKLDSDYVNSELCKQNLSLGTSNNIYEIQELHTIDEVRNIANQIHKKIAAYMSDYLLKD